MTLKEVIGFLMLAAGVVGVGGGIALVTRGQSLGYLGLAVAPFLLIIAYKNVREPVT